jgi:HD-GYP domain-containing protein (c-di-GMP phosphodiesterase class II)
MAKDREYNPSQDLGELIAAIGERSGLNPETIEDLLRKGWTYQLKLGQYDRWVKEY